MLRAADGGATASELSVAQGGLGGGGGGGGGGDAADAADAAAGGGASRERGGECACPPSRSREPDQLSAPR